MKMMSKIMGQQSLQTKLSDTSLVEKQFEAINADLNNMRDILSESNQESSRLFEAQWNTLSGQAS